MSYRPMPWPLLFSYGYLTVKEIPPSPNGYVFYNTAMWYEGVLKVERERRDRAADAELAVARADWEAVRAEHSDCASLVAVLDLHQPEKVSHSGGCRFSVVCGFCYGQQCECQELEPWPCRTYVAITGA